jgi:hypothetical protein
MGNQGKKNLQKRTRKPLKKPKEKGHVIGHKILEQTKGVADLTSNKARDIVEKRFLDLCMLQEI